MVGTAIRAAFQGSGPATSSENRRYLSRDQARPVSDIVPAVAQRHVTVEQRSIVPPHVAQLLREVNLPVEFDDGRVFVVANVAERLSATRSRLPGSRGRPWARSTSFR